MRPIYDYFVISLDCWRPALQATAGVYKILTKLGRLCGPDKNAWRAGCIGPRPVGQRWQRANEPVSDVSDTAEVEWNPDIERMKVTRTYSRHISTTVQPQYSVTTVPLRWQFVKPTKGDCISRPQDLLTATKVISTSYKRLIYTRCKLLKCLSAWVFHLLDVLYILAIFMLILFVGTKNTNYGALLKNF